MLPRDLHVLGLPLAFILRSSVKRFWLSHSFKERFGVPPLFSEAFFVTHTLLPKVMRLPGICPIAGAKVKPFFYARKFFTRFFSPDFRYFLSNRFLTSIP